MKVAPPWVEESLELLQTGGEAWNQAERAKIADLNWRIAAEKGLTGEPSVALRPVQWASWFNTEPDPVSQELFFR